MAPHTHAVKITASRNTNQAWKSSFPKCNTRNCAHLTSCNLVQRWKLFLSKEPNCKARWIPCVPLGFDPTSIDEKNHVLTIAKLSAAFRVHSGSKWSILTFSSFGGRGIGMPFFFFFHWKRLKAVTRCRRHLVCYGWACNLVEGTTSTVRNEWTFVFSNYLIC